MLNRILTLLYSSFMQTFSAKKLSFDLLFLMDFTRLSLFEVETIDPLDYTWFTQTMELVKVTKRYFANPFFNNPSMGASFVTKSWLDEQVELLVHKVTRRQYTEEETNECMSSKGFLARSKERLKTWFYTFIVERYYRRSEPQKYFFPLGSSRNFGAVYSGGLRLT